MKRDKKALAVEIVRELAQTDPTPTEGGYCRMCGHSAADPTLTTRKDLARNHHGYCLWRRAIELEQRLLPTPKTRPRLASYAVQYWQCWLPGHRHTTKKTAAACIEKQKMMQSPKGKPGRWKNNPALLDQILEQRENQKLTFKKIGDIWGVSATQAMNLYNRAHRLRNPGPMGTMPITKAQQKALDYVFGVTQE